MTIPDTTAQRIPRAHTGEQPHRIHPDPAKHKNEYILVPRCWAEHFQVLLPKLVAGDIVVVETNTQKLAVDIMLRNRAYVEPINTLTLDNWASMFKIQLADGCSVCHITIVEGRAVRVGTNTPCLCSFHKHWCNVRPMLNRSQQQRARWSKTLRHDVGEQCTCGGDELYDELVAAVPAVRQMHTTGPLNLDDCTYPERDGT